MKTQITHLLNVQHPILLAPMAGVSGGALAAAVSNAGGFGVVGGGYGDAQWVNRELDIITQSTSNPWGIGFITWAVSMEVLNSSLRHKPAAVVLSFGDPSKYAKIIKAAGAKLMCQVQTLEDIDLALNAGADVIIAQGTEAGGHGTTTRSTLPLIPIAVDHAKGVPVVAAGGIADGRGLAAILMLGADGASIGTRFAVTHESLMPAALKKLLISSSGEDTVRTHVFDIVRQYSWPSSYTGRTLSNAFTKRWHGRESILSDALTIETPAYWKADASHDYSMAAPWCGEAVDLIIDSKPAEEIVRALIRSAEDRVETVRRAIVS